MLAQENTGLNDDGVKVSLDYQVACQIVYQRSYFGYCKLDFTSDIIFCLNFNLTLIYNILLIVIILLFIIIILGVFAYYLYLNRSNIQQLSKSWALFGLSFESNSIELFAT